MASLFIPSSFTTPFAKARGNNSKPINKRGKYSRVVLRQRIAVYSHQKGFYIQRMAFHKLKGRTQTDYISEMMKGKF